VVVNYSGCYYGNKITTDTFFNRQKLNCDAPAMSTAEAELKMQPKPDRVLKIG